MSARDINRWVDDMLSRPATRNGRQVYDIDHDTGERTPRNVQANTVRIRWQNLRPFFTWWAKEMDVENPFDGADLPGIDDKPVPVIHLDDIRALLRACEGRDFEARRDTAIIRFLLDTGCRVGEMVAMSVDSWDDDRTSLPSPARQVPGSSPSPRRQAKPWPVTCDFAISTAGRGQGGRCGSSIIVVD